MRSVAARRLRDADQECVVASESGHMRPLSVRSAWTLSHIRLSARVSGRAKRSPASLTLLISLRTGQSAAAATEAPARADPGTPAFPRGIAERVSITETSNMSGIEPDDKAHLVHTVNIDFLVSEDTTNIVTTDGQPDGAVDIIASARPTSVVSASAFVGGTSAGLGALTRDTTIVECH